MDKSRYLGLRLPPDLWLEVEASVKASGLTQADWLRRSIGEAIERHAVLKSMETLLLASEQRIVLGLRVELDKALGGLEVVDAGETEEGAGNVRK